MAKAEKDRSVKQQTKIKPPRIRRGDKALLEKALERKAAVRKKTGGKGKTAKTKK